MPGKELLQVSLPDRARDFQEINYSNKRRRKAAYRRLPQRQRVASAPLRFPDLYPCSKAKLARASPTGEATGATQRNEEKRVFSPVFWVFFYLEVP
jgi:hypothetical protein